MEVIAEFKSSVTMLITNADSVTMKHSFTYVMAAYWDVSGLALTE